MRLCQTYTHTDDLGTFSCLRHEVCYENLPRSPRAFVVVCYIECGSAL